MRDESDAPLRVDANEGWTLESARELMPELIELGVEFVEQPFPADDLDSFRALRELHPRLPVIVDEGCQDLRDVAPAAAYADGINVKLAKSGGMREAVRMIHAARALGLRRDARLHDRVPARRRARRAIASLADWVDLDGHLLLADEPFTGLRFEDGRVLPGTDAGPRGGARVSERLAIFAEGLFAKHTGKTAHGVIRYGTREVVAVIDSTCAGRTADEVEPFCLQPVPIVATLDEALERGADTLLIGVAPPGGKLDPAWRPALLEAIEAGLSLEAGLHTQLADDPELREAAERARRRAARPARGAARPHRAEGPVQPARLGAGGAQRRLRHGDRQEGRDARARPRRARARPALRVRAHRPDRHRDRGLGHRGGPRDLRLRGGRRRAARASRAPSAATCCSSRARARSSTRPTPASRSACCTARRRTCSCSSTSRTPRTTATTRTCRSRR